MIRGTCYDGPKNLWLYPEQRSTATRRGMVYRFEPWLNPQIGDRNLGNRPYYAYGIRLMLADEHETEPLGRSRTGS